MTEIRGTVPAGTTKRPGGNADQNEGDMPPVRTFLLS
jgi:hypothetical protein